MGDPQDDIEVECTACGWVFFVERTDELPPGPFVCPVCNGTETETDADWAEVVIEDVED